ncbi:unnamed protein product, partial [Symbiodinium necroappetens]
MRLLAQRLTSVKHFGSGHHIREFFRSARSASWATFSTFWVFLAVASYLLYSRQDLKYWCSPKLRREGDPDAVDDWLDGYIVELILSMETWHLHGGKYFPLCSEAAVWEALSLIESQSSPLELTQEIILVSFRVTSFCQMFWQMWLFMFVASYLQDIKSLPYLLGAWLIYIGVASLREDDEDSFDPEHSDLFRMLRTGLGALSENLDTVDIWIMCSRLMPHYPHDGSATDAKDMHEECMFKRDESGKLCVTMLLPVTACIVVIMLVMEVD